MLMLILGPINSILPHATIPHSWKIFSSIISISMSMSKRSCSPLALNPSLASGPKGY